MTTGDKINIAELLCQVEKSNKKNDDRPCMGCGEDHHKTMVMCDTEMGPDVTCNNVYHLGCVGLKRSPRGKVRGSAI